MASDVEEAANYFFHKYFATHVGFELKPLIEFCFVSGLYVAITAIKNAGYSEQHEQEVKEYLEKMEKLAEKTD